MKEHTITLTPKERKTLVSIVTKGCNKASVIQRAHILLKSDEGQTDTEISNMLYISTKTIQRVRTHFGSGGLQAALENQPHPKPDPKLNMTQEAYLMALTCSEPALGRKRWTLELLSQQLVEDGMVNGIATETVRTVLKKTNSNLGR